jgi:rRNA maturation endonuclease Nob1
MPKPRQPREPSPQAREKRLRKHLEACRQFLQECRECQTEAPAHWQFCAHCGARLSTQCPGCGNPLPPSGARYCPHCGLEIPRPESEPAQ